MARANRPDSKFLHVLEKQEACYSRKIIQNHKKYAKYVRRSSIRITVVPISVTRLSPTENTRRTGDITLLIHITKELTMRCKHLLAATASLTSLLGFAVIASAHFGVITPSDDIVSQQDATKIQVTLKFIHPMEGQYMELAKPKHFGVHHEGNRTDLLPTLTASSGKGGDQKKGFTTWKADYSIKRPGDYTFFMEPTPYWEPAEDTFIVHYTKVCVNALGKEAGWDSPVGLETEIIPYTRPYGLWTGNVFTGQVLVKGKPAANADVEIEYLNESKGNPKVVQAPSDPFVTQVVKTDANGMFSYAMPRAGWWGFAALSTADWTIKKEGVDKPVEIGAVFWVLATPMR